MGDQQLSHEDYTIGWICALPKTERVAAAAMLDDEHRILPAADPRDANTYHLGRIGDHNVVIACLPAEATGKVSAATVAKDMLRSFPSIRFGLMVGIGGGVPYKAQERVNNNGNEKDYSDDESETDMEEIQDIRLGDVVVSLHSKSTEAVVQYDFGKSEQEKRFVHTGGKLNKPPNIVLNAVSRLQADHARGRYKIPEMLSAMLSDNPTMMKFQHQGFEKDRLFKPEVVHEEGKKSCKACYGVNDGNVVRRKDRSEKVPRIYYGTIGSADQVMRDAILRDQWASKENIICFEMEAAGLMDSFPCIVIRGICDYADSHKNKIWQPYAAATAASYAKELLLVIPGQGITVLSPIKQLLSVSKQLDSVNQGLSRAFEQRESHHHERMERALTEDQRRCHQVFKTSTYEERKNNNPHRIPGTCEWALRSPEYLRWWEAPNNDLLWISADPGCGKSVLAKSLVDEVFKTSDPSISIVYFFFKDNDEQNNLATALCAILHQLFSLQPQLLRHALPFWEKNHEKIQHEVGDMWRIFLAATSDPTMGKTICVFDALDECRSQDQKQLIQKLQEHHTQSHPSGERKWLKFLATSRPYDDIQDSFRSVTKSFPQIHLRGEEENDQIHEEINLVVKVKVADLGERLNLCTQKQRQLEKDLLHMNHRTYLWLYLAIDHIETALKDSFWPDQEPIPLVPKDVNDAYEKILDRVTPKQEATVKKILQIIVGARRPLTVQEMAMALGTAREFLITKVNRSTSIKWYLEPNETEIEMTRICVGYLLMDDVAGGSKQDLLNYSAENWPDHFRHIQSKDDRLDQEVYKLYNLNTKLFGLWFPIFWKAEMAYGRQPSMNALHLAAFNGHNDMVSVLVINEKYVIDQADNTNMNALRWACLRGHSNIVQILLAEGTDVNGQGGNYGNALQAASFGGHFDIIQQLLDKGADVNAQGGKYGNALQAASYRGHLNIVQQLLDKGADINAQGGEYGNALQAASCGGDLHIVQQLLSKGADVNAQGGKYGNALQTASLRRHLNIVQQLLNKGADINTQGGEYGNALQAASCGGDLHIVQQLLSKGADVNAQEGKYGNTLQAASFGGHFDIVQQLLNKGADVNAQGGEYGNALQAASYRGHLNIVQQLLDKGADVNAQEEKYGNALQAASFGGHFDIVQQLLDKGADINAHGGYFGNALQAASYRGHLNIFQRLLDKGADANAHGGYFGNALQAASYGGHLDIVQQLLDKGADVNAHGGYFGNALQAASNRGHLDIVQKLLDSTQDRGE
ncbi:putative ankyrin repeat-containing protein [Talaromyces proteolyticus]|uniref:Ankyrin repeat-containing protein n=1 Tax=Talaromyces proteolyticus TaxID=1131652 RepID=A0AAD4KT33_9EURO|nr:putative ankyrin repeat-containing protein [Talaromyces proteolyticus]KAH8696360.1 putative ankyrin repeat-containing protein [Talaromyces proteolyticus]